MAACLYPGHFCSRQLPTLLFFPTPAIVPADFTIPEGNTSDTPAVSFLTSSFVSIHLGSTEEGFPWPHPWPYHHLKLSYQWNLKPRYHALLSTSTFPISSLPLNLRVLLYEDLNSLDLCAVSYSLRVLLLPCSWLLKLNLPVGSWDYSSLINTFNFLTSLSHFSLFGFWVSRSGSWGIEHK